MGEVTTVLILANLRQPEDVPARQWYRLEQEALRGIVPEVRVAANWRQWSPADVYVSWWAARSAPVVALARLLGRRVIVVAGGTDSIPGPGVLRRHPFFYSAKPLWVRPLVRFALRWSHTVVAVSRATIPELMRLGARNVVYVPNAVDTALFRPQKRNAARAPRIATVCNMERDACYLKGLDLVLEAFALVVRSRPEARLLVIGERGAGHADVVGQVERLGLAGHVEFSGRLSNEDVAERLRGSAAFVSAARYETFGVAIAEAMACGLPVVVPRLDAIVELAGDAALYVEERSPEVYAESLLRLLDDDPLRLRLGIQGRKRILERFSLEVRREAMRRLLTG